jgi:hypothetical protein
MFFEFVPHPQFDFLTNFAKKFNVPIEGDRLIIPPVNKLTLIHRSVFPPTLSGIMKKEKRLHFKAASYGNIKTTDMNVY